MLKIVLTSLLLWASAASAVTLDQLQQRFASQPVIRADFIQTRTISGMRQPLVSHGQMLIAREQGLWWHQQTPFVMTLLLDDKRMVQSLSGQKPQVITADSNPQMFQFNHLLRALFQSRPESAERELQRGLQRSRQRSSTLELTPKAAPLNKIFNRISLAGSAYGQHQHG